MTGAGGAGTPGVLVVGDALVDVVEDPAGRRTEHPGGAGLNVAAGVATRGLGVALLCHLADDPHGSLLRSAAGQRGIDVLALPVPATGSAVSRRVDGEPGYEFSSGVGDRRFVWDDAAQERLGGVDAVAVTSFPLGVPKQVDLLVDLVRRLDVPVLLDPNVRPTLVADPPAHVTAIEQVATAGGLVKLSRQDCLHLGRADATAWAVRLVALGAPAVVLTLGADGAVAVRTGGSLVTVRARRLVDPVVDSMGAGDAVLAVVSAELATRHHGGRGLPSALHDWDRLLDLAMDAAARTCRTTGGLPASHAPGGDR